MKLPIDIEYRLDKLFPVASDRLEVERLLLSLWTTSLNVGEGQLARSILVLSDGNVSVVQNIFNSGFMGDPRDVIMSAEAKVDNPGHYFIDPFLVPDIIEPPQELDGAKVNMWAWSGHKPFGFVGNDDDPKRDIIYGLAICSYGEKEGVYRFSCDINWLVIQDSLYETIEEAIQQLPDQYKNVDVNWRPL
jgi:hypothetical protein